MDAGHFDPQTAYAAVNTMRLDDNRPHLFRTHDAGKTWTEIDNGIPTGATSTIREDPRQKGLLYAGTETQVYVSFDDGDHWQSLRLNMPPSSVRDLAVKDDDLIAGTHGRGFLILDNVTPLRQIAAHVQADKPVLYTPQHALRIRNDMNPPTPWPPDMATGDNPPSGAMIDYFLPAAAASAVTLEIVDSKGAVVSRYRSTDPVPPLDPRYPVPTLWARPPRMLSAAPGHHRFLWDMHYPQVPGMSTEPDADQAVPHDTPQVETSPWVMPGMYQVRLSVGDQVQTQPIEVVMDPRVKTPTADLQQQFDVSRDLYDDMLKATAAIHEITVLRGQLSQKAAPATEAKADEKIKGSTQGGKAATNPKVTLGESLETNLDKIAGREQGTHGGPRGGPASAPTLISVRLQLSRIEHSIQSADCKPTDAQVEAFKTASHPLPGLLAQWQALKKTQLQAVNAERARQNLPALTLNTDALDHDVQDQIEVGDEE